MNVDKILKKEAYRKWVDSNRDKRRLIDSKYREKNKEKVRQRKREYYLKNKQRCLDKTAKWQRDNPDLVKERNHRWVKNNPTAKRIFCAKRRAKQKDASVDLDEWGKSIISCLYDARKRISDCLGIIFHVDHIIPISRGGKHCPKNLQLLPAILNCRKGSSL